MKVLYELKSFNAAELNKYAEFLVSKVANSQRNQFKRVLIDGFETEANCCHDNVSFYVEDNQNHKRRNGWLVVKYEDVKRYDFYCHAVVEDPHGVVFDITLRESASRDFIDSFISDEQFKIISHDRGITKLRYNCE